MLETQERNSSTAAELSRCQVPTAIPPLDVIKVLQEQRIRFVLVGDYALAVWTKKPRATQTVEVAVAANHLQKAQRALGAAFPNLELVAAPLVIRFLDQTKEELIRILKPLVPPYDEIFKHARSLKSGDLHYRVPSLEMALVMRFLDATCIYSEEADKLQAKVDFIRMVKANPRFRQKELAALASLLYADAVRDVLKEIRYAQAAQPVI